MKKSERELREEIDRIKCDSLYELGKAIKDKEVRIEDFLISVVSSLCGVDEKEMMTSTKSMHVSRSRWLFWYAYRYMTNDTFKHIADITTRHGRYFTFQGIQNSVNKMGVIINTEMSWGKKWNTIKSLIAYYQGTDEERSIDPNREKVTLVVPQQYKNKIDIIFI